MARFGQELSGDYIPLETGLWDDVSFNKGCYTGQEIIARMESRGRLAKKLVRIAGDGTFAAGDEISAESKNAGTITSAASANGKTIGLAYIKTKFLEANLHAGETPLTVQQ